MDSPEKIAYEHIAMIILKYTKIILGYHTTFFAACIWKLHEIQFGPKISFYIWCDYFMSESLVYTANLQNMIL